MLSQKIHRLPTTWLIAFILLSAAPELRLGDIQALEVLQLVRLLIIAFFFVWIGLKLPRTGLLRQYGAGYIFFLLVALALALLSLRLSFYPPPEISFFKKPLILSISRILELFLVIYFMLSTAETLRQNPKLLRIALDTYAAVGTLSAVASLLAFAIFQTTRTDIFQFDNPDYSFLINGLDHRVCGLFNEGGPYGLFLVSVFLMILVRRHLYPYRHPLLSHFALLCTAVAFFASASKAGILAAISCGTVMVFFSKSRKRLLAYSLLPIACLALLLLFRGSFSSYAFTISNLDAILPFNSANRNVVMGRVMAFFVVPRMILAHPILGIGLGNYSLMRNDPSYRQGLPPMDDWDLPGLGLFSSAAELGIPLTLLLVLLLCRPFRQSRKQGAPAILAASAVFQPMAALVGVNMNFFYPWLVTAFVLSALNFQRPQAARA